MLGKNVGGFVAMNWNIDEVGIHVGNVKQLHFKGYFAQNFYTGGMEVSKVSSIVECQWP